MKNNTDFKMRTAIEMLINYFKEAGISQTQLAQVSCKLNLNVTTTELSKSMPDSKSNPPLGEMKLNKIQKRLEKLKIIFDTECQKDTNKFIEHSLKNIHIDSNLHTLTENQWWLYYYHDTEKCLARGLVTFNKNKTLEILHCKDQTEDRIYTGNYERNKDILILNLKDKELNEKHLQILLRLGNGIVNIVLGLFHNVNDASNILGGTIAMERIQANKQEIFKPEIFKDLPSKEVVPDVITKFFNSKRNNHIKVPSNVLNLNSFTTFFKEQFNKQKTPDKVYYSTDVYFSAPIYSVSMDMFWEIKEVIKEIGIVLKEKCNLNNFYFLGDCIATEEYYGFKIINEVPVEPTIEYLENSKYHIVICHGELSRGMFIELGWTLKSYKKCFIFYDTLERFPKMINKLVESGKYNIKSHKYDSLKDICPYLKYIAKDFFRDE